MKITSRFHKISWLFLLIGLIILTFSPCLKNGFVNWDEDKYLLENASIRDLSFTGLAKQLNPCAVGIYFPLTTFTYSVEYHFFKLAPLIYHFDNLFLHLLNALLVFWLIYLLTSKFEIALLTAAMFGVSPLRVESVAWVMERKDVLYSFFYLGAMISYIKFIKGRLSGYFVGVLFLFLCSILAKPQAVSFPFFMLVIDRFYKRPWSRSLLLEKLPFFLISLIVIFLGRYLVSIQHFVLPNQDPQLLLAGSYLLVISFIKSFIPFHLSCIHPIPREANGLFSWTVFASIFIVLGAGGFIVKRYSKDRVMMFGFLFYVVLMSLPILNLQFYPGLIYEHYSYLASVGLYFLFACQYSQWLDQQRSERIKQVGLFLLGIYFLAFATMSFQRCGVWKNSMTLWTDVIEHRLKDKPIDPNFAVAYNNRGNAYIAQGNFTEAVSDFDKSIETDPHYANAYNNRGFVYYQQGNFTEAISDFNKALAENIEFADAYNDRGVVYYKQGQLTQAISDFNKAIEIKSDYADAYFNRGLAYFQQSDLNHAAKDFNKAIEIDPNNYADAYNDLGLIYASQGDLEGAQPYFTKAIAINPNDAQAYCNRGNTYYLQAQYSQALSDYTKAIEIDAHDVEAYKNRFIVYYKLAQYDLAWQDVQKASELGGEVNPKFLDYLIKATGRNR